MDDFLLGFIQNTIRTMIPICIASTGAVFSARVGIMALGLEGMMLVGAFGAAYGSFLTGDAIIGIVMGVLFGGSIGLIHGILTTKYDVNHIISGVGLNLLAAGLTTLLLQGVWGNRGNGEMVPTLKPFHVPILGRVSPLLIVMILLVIGAHIFLFKTKYGLRMRMVGENPTAASTVGINVVRTKYIGATLTGLISGLAGSYLSIDLLNMFARDMTAGRGYMAVCANVLGRYTPMGAFMSSLLFGGADALQMMMQGKAISNRLIQMLPYVVTMIALIFAGKYVRAPKGLGENIEHN
ncbi:MAG: ABC transporter permease [Lachnospirales bacterium]